MTPFFRFQKVQISHPEYYVKNHNFSQSRKMTFFWPIFFVFFWFFSLFSKSDRNESESLSSLSTLVIFGPFFDPFLVLSGYFQGAFWRPLILGVSKSVILGSKITENWIVNFDHLGRFCVTFFARSSKFEPRKDPENEQKVPKKRSKKGSKRGRFWVSDPLPGVQNDPPNGSSFFRSISQFADGIPQLLSKIEFSKWPKKCLFEKLIYKMSSTLTCVCACARARTRPLFIY